jgi:hypothetical protein
MFMQALTATTCVVVFGFASAVSAHAVERQSVRTPTTTTTTTPDDNIERGSFGYELLGGSIGLTFGAGITYAVVAHHISSCSPSGHVMSPCEFEGMAAMMTHVFLTTPLLVVGGVIVGGNATGSNGRFFSTWGGAVLGMLAGFLLTAPLANDDASYETRLATIPVIGLTTVGGAVLFYRNSATAPRVSLAPANSGDGAMLTLRGLL